MTHEREITEPVSLTLGNGRLNPDAVGWTRTALHNTDRIGVGRYGWGRNKRWEYWAFLTPTHFIALTVSSIDYAAVHELWVFDRASGESIRTSAIGILGSTATLPGTVARGPSRTRTRNLDIDIEELPTGTRIQAFTSRVVLDVTVGRDPQHETLGVVVPWNDRLFQYTVKDVGRPVSGVVAIDGVRHRISQRDSWAVLDHGRGRWPYSMHWNWGAAAGLDGEGRTIGLQLGGKWTDGTGMTENALYVDGRLHKLGAALSWEYDTTDYLSPWRIHSDAVELSFEPFHDKTSSINLGIFASRTHQCFGHYSGWVRDDAGTPIVVERLTGFAEDVRNRW